jgi:DNA-binding CsgD family transcriptional regulator
LIPAGETALLMAREMGWRSAETATLSCLAQCLGSMGEYGRALNLGQTALEVAEEIQHREWISSTCWALGYLGKSNREIAQDLYVSERTAATHVSNILNMLGYSSRAQIAVWAMDNGLTRRG